MTDVETLTKQVEDLMKSKAQKTLEERGLVVRRWICNPEIPSSNPPPSHWMDLSLVAPNSTPPRLVNSQLVCLPPVGILNLLCLICMILVCYAHLNIFTWNLRDINVYYYYV